MAKNPFAKKEEEGSSLPKPEDEFMSSLSRPVENTTATAGFEDLLKDDDDETKALTKAREEAQKAGQKAYMGTSIEDMLDQNYKALRKKYPMGGRKTSRFITTDVLLRMPENYFDHHQDLIRKGVVSIQTEIAESGRSDIIGKSQSNPTDESLQDEAYRTVHGQAVAFMEKYHHSAIDRAVIITMICNEIIGFGPLEPLWRDRRITEIICNGPFDIQIEISGKLLKVPGVKFRDQAHLLALIERLYSSIGKTLSQTHPIEPGSLHDRSRMEAVHTSVAPEGPNFNIRRHQEGFVLPEDLLDWGSASEEMLHMLGNLVYREASLLVSGGTGSGKTTLLNALTSYIRPGVRVVTLEDTIEMKVHPKKFKAKSMGCLPGRTDRPEDRGVTMRDLVKSSLRLRPNIIIVGEVRDEAAYDLCQALNTGHSGFSTVHANSPYEAIYRLVSLVSQGSLMAGTQALPAIASAFDFIIQVENMTVDGSRKVVGISEVSPYPVLNEKTNELHLPTIPIWEYRTTGIKDGKVEGVWEKKNEISEERRRRLKMDLEPDLTWEQLKMLSKLD